MRHVCHIEQMKKITVYLSPEMFVALKAVAAAQRRSVTRQCATLLEAALGGKSAKRLASC